MRRVLTRAARAYLAGRRGEAFLIIMEADPTAWQPFFAGMRDHARGRYLRRMGIAP